jgi:hypothetical protein
MTDARAISAQLVDIRNVGTHKVVKLTIHAPQEHAMHIMELFGWPTQVDPVPVALARLQPGAGAEQTRKPDTSSDLPASGVEVSVPNSGFDSRDRGQTRREGDADDSVDKPDFTRSADVAPPAQHRTAGRAPSDRTDEWDMRPRPKRSWDELSATAQAVMRCKEPSFHKFLKENYEPAWDLAANSHEDRISTAAFIVRRICGVSSRSQINIANRDAFSAWQGLDNDYRLWMMVPA